VYVNVEDTSEILHIDAQKMTVLTSLAAGPVLKSRPGMAMGPKFAAFSPSADN